MRIVVEATSEVGVRAAGLLLGEPDLGELALLPRGTAEPGPDFVTVGTVDGFDAVITDDPASGVAVEALAATVPCVLPSGEPDLPGDAGFGVLLIGANLVDGIGRALLARETSSRDASRRLRFAWTEPGKPLGEGPVVTFPDPVGARRGTLRRSTEHLVEIAVPVPGEWAGVVVGPAHGDGSNTVGIADLAVHLDAIALAAGAVVAARGLLPSGTSRPESVVDPYLAAAFRIGLDAAVFHPSVRPSP